LYDYYYDYEWYCLPPLPPPRVIHEWVETYNVCTKSSYVRLYAHNMRKSHGPDITALYRIAEQQGGYFTTAQATKARFNRKLLWHHQRNGKLLRGAHGIYRFRQFPASPHEDLFVAWLRCGPRAVVSHESALAVYGLSDIMPGETHVTVPRTSSRRREGIRQHTARLLPSEIVRREGLPVTSVPRTLADVARAGLAEEHILEAIDQALKEGLITLKALRIQARRRGGRIAQLTRHYEARGGQGS
jgi:predicted transcriptional regulator of viral defense system